MFSKFQYLPWCEKRSLRGPRLEDQCEAFLEALVGLLHRNAEARELVVAVALADAEFEPAAGEQIDGRGLLGQQHRIVPRQHHHRGAEPQRRGARRHPGQQIEARRDLAEAGEMMLDHEGRVVAERLGLDVVFDVVAKALAAVEVGAAALRLGAAEQSEFHPGHPWLRLPVRDFTVPCQRRARHCDQDRLRAVDGRAAQIDRRDFSRVVDVVQRIGVEHDEVGALAGLQRARVGDPQELGAVAGRRDDAPAPASCRPAPCPPSPRAGPTAGCRRCPCTMRTPAAFILARLRAWMPWNACATCAPVDVLAFSSLANSSATCRPASSSGPPSRRDPAGSD